MQILRSVLLLFAAFTFFSARSQSLLMDPQSKDLHFIDRMEIKLQRDSILNMSTARPLNRQSIMLALDTLTMPLSVQDQYNWHSLRMNNVEWSANPDAWTSKRPLWKTFYRNHGNFWERRNKDFYLAINPILNLQIGKEIGYDKTIYRNTRGISIRGQLGNRLGFFTSLQENQERDPQFYQQRVNATRALPGVGYYKIFKDDSSAYDFFDARAYLTFRAAKFVDIQFGYDKNVIGNGYRSLFLSDWGNSYLFAKINVRFWKLNYQNTYMELLPQFYKTKDTLLSRKYAAMHHLSIQARPWLNVGLFEGVVFGRRDRFDFQYLNPIIFYRHIEGTIGSPDNAFAGLDLKANVRKRAQIYGQVMLDEFIIQRALKDPSNWTNKFGFQLGVKYIDVLGVSNLDIQVEANRVRPFTYSHFDTVSNYTHYNQPLAHPLGANFQELIGIVRYQPTPRLTLYGRVQWYEQGLDSAGRNFGANIFQDYRTRAREDGFRMAGGIRTTCANAILNLSYEWKQNLFIDLGLQHRQFRAENSADIKRASVITVGLRLNAARREGDF
ncbi:MAG: hypothetical protein ACKO5C_07340 [Ferruginibacter sp.]